MKCQVFEKLLLVFQIEGEVLFQTMRTFPSCTIKPTGEKEKQDRDVSMLVSQNIGLNSHMPEYLSFIAMSHAT